MKKIVAIILTLIMVLSVVNVASVFAAAKPTITVETVEAAAGDTVNVKINISNNPGIWGLKITVNYDKNVLTLKDAVNGDFFDESEWTKGASEKVPYTLSYGANDFNNITKASGTLAILTFKIKDTAENGDYNITAEYEVGNIIDSNFNDIEFAVINGKVTVKDMVRIVGATVDIGSSLTINYFASAPQNAVMKFTSSTGRVTEVNGVLDEKTGYYKFKYTGINPQCMNDTLKAELIAGGEVLAVKENYSVKAYCDNMATGQSGLNLSASQHKQLTTLLADMLTYGSAAQEYRDYNTENLADASNWVGEYKSTFTVPAGVKNVTGNTDVDNKVKSVGLHMANVNKIYFKMILTDDVIVKLNGAVVDKSTFVKNDDGAYTVYSDGIMATQFDDVFTLTLEKNGETISTVQYNVNAYIQAKYNASGVLNIVKALSNYGASATRYQKALIENDFNLEEDEL